MTLGAPDERPEPGGKLFWLSAIAGWIVIAYGIRGLLHHHVDTNPSDLAWFFVGGALLHDLLVAPLLLIAGVLVARSVPGRARAIVQAALIVSGALALFAYPFIRGYGHAVHNPSALPHNYTADLAIALAVVWGVASVLVVALLWRRRPSTRA
jgi:hypothetical protein